MYQNIKKMTLEDARDQGILKTYDWFVINGVEWRYIENTLLGRVVIEKDNKVLRTLTTPQVKGISPLELYDGLMAMKQTLHIILDGKSNGSRSNPWTIAEAS